MNIIFFLSSRRRHTRWPRDWSSDVCSSDLAPAGIGPAALYLRFLNRRGVRASLAVATVALVQVAGFVVTVLLLLFFSLITGNAGVLRQLPDGALLWTIGIAGVAIADRKSVV